MMDSFHACRPISHLWPASISFTYWHSVGEVVSMTLLAFTFTRFFWYPIKAELIQASTTFFFSKFCSVVKLNAWPDRPWVTWTMVECASHCEARVGPDWQDDVELRELMYVTTGSWTQENPCLSLLGAEPMRTQLAGQCGTEETHVCQYWELNPRNLMSVTIGSSTQETSCLSLLRT